MKKRILSIIVLMLLLNFTLFIGDQNYIYANEGVHTNTDGERQTENLFEGENYSVVFELVDTWESGYKATVTIKNTGDETIQNWCIVCCKKCWMESGYFARKKCFLWIYSRK